MKSHTLKEILLHTGGNIIQGNENLVIKNVVTKSKRIIRDTLFIHYKKGKINWHLVKFDRTNAVITEDPAPFLKHVSKDVTIIRVNDIKRAYWAFVNYYRGLFNIPVIGVTGTCGKTTTTEMIKTILSDKYVVQSTKNGKNGLAFNLPYLLGIDANTQATVIEMGVSYPGDLINTCKHFKPHIGVILNIGKYHLKYCKTPENYIKAKARLIQGMSQTGTLILNYDDENIKKISLSGFKGKILYFGFSDKAHFYATNLKYSDTGMEFILNHGGKCCPCRVTGFGPHNVYDALAAIAASHAAGIDIQAAVEKMAVFKPIRRHLHFCTGHNGCTVIDDTWNCTPPSVKSALQVLSDMAGSRKKIAVLGYMPQLGEAGFDEYDKIGVKVVETGTDLLITIGDEAERIGKKAVQSGLPAENFRSCKSAEEVLEALGPYLNKNSLILFKFPYNYRLKKIPSFKTFMKTILLD